MLTASMLFAPEKYRIGPHTCYYCGAPCGADYPSREFVKDTFTNRDIVKYPGSGFVCGGCVASLGAGPDEMMMIDGNVKKRENDRGMQPRMYSWVITRHRRVAATKAHISFLRNVVLNPPEPPFCIILADSGQKQLIFRSPVALSQEVFPVMLEDTVITVNPIELGRLITIASRLCAAIGKPALMDCASTQYAIACEKYHGDIEPLEAWLDVMSCPQSRIAMWLCPNKEDSQHEYPGIERGTVSSEACRAHRSTETDGRDGGLSDEGRDSQIRFDFA